MEVAAVIAASAASFAPIERPARRLIRRGGRRLPGRAPIAPTSRERAAPTY